MVDAVEMTGKKSTVEQMKLFTGGVYISPTTKCNARCRHCIAQDDEPEFVDANYEDMMSWLDQIKECGIKTVHFVGGEPFVVFDHLVNYIKRLGELGITPSVVTNGSWAKTKEKGIEVLKKLPALEILIISSDKYHLEYIDAKTVRNAIEAGLECNKYVVVNITYIEKEDLSSVSHLYKDYGDRITMQTVKAMPFHGEESNKIARHQYFKRITKAPKFCGIGNYFINYDGNVYACCQASRSLNTNYLTLGNLYEERLSEMDKRMKQNPVYQFISSKGPRGIAEIFASSDYFNDLQECSYAGGCEICQSLLDTTDKYQYFLERIRE